MKPALEQMTNEEKERNTHGPHLVYQWTEENLGTYVSPIPGHFPDIFNHHAGYVAILTKKVIVVTI